MAVKAYSKGADGNKKLSSHFKVKEFACSDGICLQRKKETFIKIFGGEKRMETTRY